MVIMHNFILHSTCIIGYFRGHRADETKEFTTGDDREKVLSWNIIPGGLTPVAVAQPLDKVDNKVFK